MKRVLLTGATGFLGRACIPPLIRHGYEIHGVYYHSNVASKIGDNVIWHQANLLDSAAVRQLVTEAKPSDLLHLAWDVNPKTYWNSPENFRWVQGTIALW